MPSALYISKYLIHKAAEEVGGELLSNMKLQKLLYYTQGFYYAKYQEKLFEDKIHAWQYGPVVASVYHDYKRFGSNGISLGAYPDRWRLTEKQIEMIDEVYEVFNQFSAVKLMRMTHCEAPWKSTAIKDEISLEKLEKHFKAFISEEDE